MNSDWITVDKTSGNGEGIIKVTCLENTNAQERTSNIKVITNGGIVKTLTVTQQAGEYKDQYYYLIIIGDFYIYNNLSNGEALEEVSLYLHMRSTEGDTEKYLMGTILNIPNKEKALFSTDVDLKILIPGDAAPINIIEYVSIETKGGNTNLNGEVQGEMGFDYGNSDYAVGMTIGSFTDGCIYLDDWLTLPVTPNKEFILDISDTTENGIVINELY